jgi:hypothetical protein
MIGKQVPCINDKNRPSEIPIDKWLVKGTEYTISAFDKLAMLGGELGVQVEELDISDCAPYTYFAASRFGIVEDSPDELEDALEEVSVKVRDIELV